MLSANSLECSKSPELSLIVGLVVETLCLLGRCPVSFLIFSGLRGGLFLAGIGYYLVALVRAGSNGE